MYQIVRPRNPLVDVLASGQPADLLAPRTAVSTGAGGMFGNRNPAVSKELLDSIVNDELNNPVQHWGQAALRPFFGLLKGRSDRAAADYAMEERQRQAQALASGLSGINAGMDEQGNIDLASILAGADSPEMVQALAGYADKRGNTRYDRFDKERDFQTRRSDVEWEKDFKTQGYEDGRGDVAFERALKQSAEERAQGKYETELNAYGEPKAALDSEGNPVYFQTNPKGDPRTLPGGYKPSSGEFLDTNRKLTPAEVATNREIQAARQMILNAKAQGIDVTNSFDDRFTELVKKATQSYAGGNDPDYEKFMEALTGTSAAPPPPATDNAPQGTVEGKANQRLIAPPTGEGAPISVPGGAPAQNPAPGAAPSVNPLEGASLVDILAGNVPDVGYSPAQQQFSGSYGMVTGVAPAGPDGKPDKSKMVVGQLYEIKDKTGKVRVVSPLPDGTFEVVR